MAATTQDELLTLTQKEYAKLADLLATVEEATALIEDDDETSIRDIVAHRSHWIGLYFGWYFDGLAGEEVHFPAKGYKWNELKRYNESLRRLHADLSWNEACTNLAEAHWDLIKFIESRSDDDLYSGPMVGAKNDWTPGRWAEAAGASHYRSAAKTIRHHLRERSDVVKN